MTLKRVGAAGAAVVLLLLGAYAGFLGIRSRQAISLGVAGRYPVGRAFHELADRSRTDSLAPLGGNPRVLSVTLWYPAASTGKPSAYAPGAWGGLHRFGWAETAFGKIATGTYDDVPVAAGAFPIVVLLPGLGFSAPQYTAVGAALAAQGYLVAGVTPTYSANVTVIAGRAVRASAAGDPPDVGGVRGQGLVAVWAADARFAAAQVRVLLGVHAAAGPIVYAGHSFGGAAAIEACRGDVTCAGAADLDGTPVGTAGLAAPLLLLSSGADGIDEDPAAQQLFAASGSSAWAYTITDARHFDFSDYGAYWLAAPVRAVLPLGSPATLEVTRRYLAAFLATAFGHRAWRAPEITGVHAADMLAR